ncbi:hypothetical protein ACHQM5_021472 [Ranunculus cassubicifolius]
MAIQVDHGFSELKHVDNNSEVYIPFFDFTSEPDNDDFRNYVYNPYITLPADTKGLPDIFEDQPERLNVLRNSSLPRRGGFIAPPCRVCRTDGYQCGHYYYDEISEVYTMKHCFMCGQYGDHFASKCPFPKGQKYEAPDSSDESD